MDHDGYLSSSPSISEEEIDFKYVYALRTFIAAEEGQANAMKGDEMILLNDTNSYWWLVRLVKDSSVGFLPAEHIETPSERLARLNKYRNGELSYDCSDDESKPQISNTSSKKLKKSAHPAPTVSFTEISTYVSASEYEYSDDEYSDFSDIDETEENDDEVDAEVELEETKKEEVQDVKKSNSIFSLMARNKNRKLAMASSPDPQNVKRNSEPTQSIDSLVEEHEEKPKRRSLLMARPSVDDFKKTSNPASSAAPSVIGGLFRRISRRDSTNTRPQTEESNTQTADSPNPSPSSESTETRQPTQKPTLKISTDALPSKRISGEPTIKNVELASSVVPPAGDSSPLSKSTPLDDKPPIDSSHISLNQAEVKSLESPADRDTTVSNESSLEAQDTTEGQDGSIRNQGAHSSSTMSPTLSAPALVDDRDDSSTGTSQAELEEVIKPTTAGSIGCLSALLDSNKLHPDIVPIFRETSLRLDQMNDVSITMRVVTCEY